MKKLKELKEYYIGKEFYGFSWNGDMDGVYYNKGHMDCYVGKKIKINCVSKLNRRKDWYSVSGVMDDGRFIGYYYPTEGVDNNLIIEKTEEEITQDILSLIKKVI